MNWNLPSCINQLISSGWSLTRIEVKDRIFSYSITKQPMKTIDSAPYKIEAVWYLPELRRESRRGQGWKDLHRDFEQLGHQSPAAIYVDVNYRDE